MIAFVGLAWAEETVYFGEVFAHEAAAPTYGYERRVGEQGDGLVVATHLTRDPDQRVVHAESAVHDPDYGLVAYTLLCDQLDRTGSIAVAGREITFHLADARGDHTAVE